MPSKDKSYLESCLNNIRNYCNYQERTIFEVKEKIKTFQLEKGHEEKIVRQLIKEEYLNEERFAKTFAISKLRINKWGRKKIFYALSQKHIPEIFIQMGLAEINEDEYNNTIRELIKRKRKELKEADNYKLNNKIASYLITKGFEPDTVWRIINYNH